ncbi:hypothetical protein FB446DRAFT_817321 [Lentinula raphanica]|nr:hypothetical protein FB446DRAFT_817321 [Lentinula raphanica]KAJ3821245.1 hypothetical protein F5880DRAFT_846701 [Lentinula raphanica]
MEKYSAYRDPGTGIQPFLTPVPSPGSHSAILSIALLPLQYVVALLRLILIFLLAILYVFAAVILAAIPSLKRVISSAIVRVILLCLGFFWISPEIVSKKRGRTQQTTDSWTPRAGDVIISNWASWIELLWLSYRFDPLFLLPIPESDVQEAPSVTSSPISSTPGRRSARSSMPEVTSTSRKPSSQVEIIGFSPVSLFTMLRETGSAPPYASATKHTPQSLEEIRKTSNRPIVVFPECTTSNGRGLLRFASLFKQHSLPVKGWNVFIMCVRYDPPTGLSPTVTHSIPSLSSSLNPLPHVFALASSLALPALTIRLLAQSDSPSSPTFLVNEVLNVGASTQDQLAEASAVLIAHLGKFKRMTMGWEDKVRFLDFYGSKRT